jgi:hypothetical protein
MWETEIGQFIGQFSWEANKNITEGEELKVTPTISLDDLIKMKMERLMYVMGV